MQTRLVCHRLQSRHLEDGLCSITEYGTRLPAASTDWGLHYSSLGIRKSVCYVAIRGSLGKRPTTSVTEMSTTLYSRADARWMPMVTPSIFIMELLTAPSRWPAAAFARY